MATSLLLPRKLPLPDPPILTFLYQTPTILLRRSYASDAFGEITTLELKHQQRNKISADWSKVNRSATRRRTIKPIQTRNSRRTPQYAERNESRRPSFRREDRDREREQIDHIPFEGPSASAPATILERLSGQTMTRHEFNIFKDVLSRGANAEAALLESTRRRRQQDSTGRSRGVVREGVEMPDLLKPLAEEAEGITAERMKEEKGRVEEEEQLKEEGRTRRWRNKIVKAMDEAPSDSQLWEVFSGRLKAAVEIVLEGKRDKEVNLTTVTSTLPHLLLHMSNLLRTRFLGSGYSLALLPQLRRMGGKAFAMGASTDLFNAHMTVLFENYGDLDGVVAVLGEMERDVYEFNEGTHVLLERIFERAERAAKGKEGSAIKALWGSERKVRALEKLEMWEGIVAERIGKQEARRREWETAKRDEEGGEEEPVVEI